MALRSFPRDLDALSGKTRQMSNTRAILLARRVVWYNFRQGDNDLFDGGTPLATTFERGKQKISPQRTPNTKIFLCVLAVQKELDNEVNNANQSHD
jgi:hypothetical protein